MPNMKLRLIFIILVASMFTMLSHGFIPHHHHSHSIVSHKENDCHSDADEHESDHEPPFHCHAFNDADWYKQNQDNKIIYIKTVILTVLNITRKEPSEQKSKFVTRRKPLRKEYYHSYYPTRPPPFLS